MKEMGWSELLVRVKNLHYEPPTFWEVVKRFLTLGFLLLAIQVSAEKAPPVITIDVFPRIVAVPIGQEASVRVRVTIERHHYNRYLDITWLSDDGKSGSEQMSLDEHSARVFTKFIPIEAGEYKFFACLERMDSDAASYNGHTICTREVPVTAQ